MSEPFLTSLTSPSNLMSKILTCFLIYLPQIIFLPRNMLHETRELSIAFTKYCLLQIAGTYMCE